MKHRLEMEENYNLTRQKEYEETIEKEHQRYLNAQTKYRNQVGMQIEKHIEIMDAKKRLMHDRDLNWIHENITIDIVKLALQVFSTLVAFLTLTPTIECYSSPSSIRSKMIKKKCHLKKSANGSIPN